MSRRPAGRPPPRRHRRSSSLLDRAARLRGLPGGPARRPAPGQAGRRRGGVLYLGRVVAGPRLRARAWWPPRPSPRSAWCWPGSDVQLAGWPPSSPCVALPVVWMTDFTGGVLPQWGGRYILTSGLAAGRGRRRPHRADLTRWARQLLRGPGRGVTVFGLVWMSQRTHRWPGPAPGSAPGPSRWWCRTCSSGCASRAATSPTTVADRRRAGAAGPGRPASSTDAGFDRFGLITATSPGHPSPAVPGYHAVSHQVQRWLGVHFRYTVYAAGRHVTAAAAARAGRRRPGVVAAPLWARTPCWPLVLVVSLAGHRAHVVAFSSDEGVAVIQAHMLRDGHGWLYRYPLASHRSPGPGPTVRPRRRRDPRAWRPTPSTRSTRSCWPASTWSAAAGPCWPWAWPGTAGGRRAGRPAGPAAGPAPRSPGPVAGRRRPARCSSTPTWCWPTPWPRPRWPPACWPPLSALAPAPEPRPAGAGALVGDGRRLAGGLACCAPRPCFVGPALAVACRWWRGWRRRCRPGAPWWWPWPRWRASAAAWLIDQLAARAIIGHARLGARRTSAVSSWVDGRWQALHTTWLQASYARRPAPATPLLGLGRCAAVGGRPAPALAPTTAAGLGGERAGRWPWPATWCAWSVGPAGAVPGLALAFPAGWFLLWAVGPASARGRGSTP